MSNPSNIKEQIRRNLVALISLVIALTSLGYNTWRNEASEANRNQRLVSIEMLVMLGDLQRLTLDIQYGKASDRPSLLREAWARVLTLRDLSRIAEKGVPDATADLFDSWQQNFQALGSNDEGPSKSIVAALESVRMELHEVLKSLD